MPIQYTSDKALFQDVIEVAEAEGLLEWLQTRPTASVSLSDCTHIHPANLQVLLAANVKITRWPGDPDLRTWLKSFLRHK